MKALLILFWCTCSCATTLNIFIDGPVTVFLDCRSQSQDSRPMAKTTAKAHFSEEPEVITNSSHTTVEPVDEYDLYEAASNGNLSFINAAIPRLEASGLNLNSPFWIAEKTALHIAAENNQPSIVTALLEAGANPDVQDNYGWTPILTAVRENHISVLRLLLEEKYQADVNLGTNLGYTPVYDAVLQDHNTALELLLAHGGDPNKLTSVMSPLMAATGERNEKAAKLLIKAGAHVNYARPNDGNTALHIVPWGYEEGARVLLENGASKSIRNQQGETPSDRARRLENGSVAQFIDNY